MTAEKRTEFQFVIGFKKDKSAPSVLLAILRRGEEASIDHDAAFAVAAMRLADQPEIERVGVLELYENDDETVFLFRLGELFLAADLPPKALKYHIWNFLLAVKIALAPSAFFTESGTPISHVVN